MRNTSCRVAVLSAAVVAVTAGWSHASEQFFSPGDFAIAIDAIPNYYIDDTGTGGTFSMYPFPAEVPQSLVDGSLDTKYLNFGRLGAGFIVVPGSSTVQSFQLSTANDATGRDPTSYVLLGTNDPVLSEDRSNGLGENWTIIQQGPVSLPDTRTTAGPIVNVTNSTSYAAYKMYFPTLKDAAGSNSMQLSEAQFFTAPDGGGSTILNAGTDIRAIDNPQAESAYNSGEGPAQALDQNPNTKYTNLMNGSAGNDTNHGPGLIVTPKRGPSIVDSFQITTGNDFPTRDPIGYEIFGTNDPIQSTNNSDGNGGEAWTMIGSGSLSLPDTRLTAGDVVPLTNATQYTSYKIVFTDTKGSGNVQIADIAFNGTLTGATEWNTDASGDWLNAFNWYGPMPNAVGDTARFLAKSTSAHTIFADGAVTVGTLRIENSSTYLITGAGSLTIETASGNGSINVSGAAHKINLPLFINSSTDVNVAAGATLTIGNPTTVASGKSLNTSGNVIIQAPLILESSGLLSVTRGQTTLSGAPLLGSGARVDVKANSLKIDYQGKSSSPAEAIKTQLIAGYNGGAWNGSGGITSSASIAGVTGLGWKDDAANQNISIKYTWYGDANLDGQVDVTDLGMLATNWQNSAVWAGGDFNYDGLVDVTDLGALASNWQKGVASPLGADSLAAALSAVGLGGVSVPEPAAMSLLGTGIAAMVVRRRRRGFKL